MKNHYTIVGDKVFIELNKGRNKGITTMIDIEDLPKAKQFPGTWRSIENGNTVYVCGTIYNKTGSTTIYLHRFITNCPEGFVVDHINFNGLMNTRDNLRIVTHAENLQNLCGAKSTSKSGLRNIFFDKYFNKWVVEVAVNGKVVYKKRFTHIEDAEVAAAMARLKYQPFSPEGTAARMAHPKYPKLEKYVEYDLDS